MPDLCNITKEIVKIGYTALGPLTNIKGMKSSGYHKVGAGLVQRGFSAENRVPPREGWRCLPATQTLEVLLKGTPAQVDAAVIGGITSFPKT